MKFVHVHFVCVCYYCDELNSYYTVPWSFFYLKSRHVLKGKQVEVLHDLVTVSREYTFDIGR